MVELSVMVMDAYVNQGGRVVVGGGLPKGKVAIEVEVVESDASVVVSVPAVGDVVGVGAAGDDASGEDVLVDVSVPVIGVVVGV